MNFLGKSFIKGADLTTRRIAGETLIVPVRGHVGDLDSIYTLNEVGSRIWQLIDEPLSAREVAEIISTEYDVSAEEAEEDVTALLALMAETGLIRAAAESEKS